MNKIFWLLKKYSLSFLERVSWYFGFKVQEENFKLRRENQELLAHYEGMQRICGALIDCDFGVCSEEDVTINWLMAQYNVFFVNAAFERFDSEEFFFMRKVFMQALATSYQLGLQKGDRVAKEVK